MLIFCCCLTEIFCEIYKILSLVQSLICGREHRGVTFLIRSFFTAPRDISSTSRTGSSTEFHFSTWTSRRFCRAFCLCTSSLFSIRGLSAERQRFHGTGSFSQNRFDFTMKLMRYCWKIFKNWTTSDREN